MTKYEILKKRICEALPRLMELKPYNEILIPKDFSQQVFSYTIVSVLESNSYLNPHKTWEGDVLHEEMTQIVLVKNNAISYELERFAVKDCIWNGIDPTLSDVLEWWDTLINKGYFEILAQGAVFIKSFGDDTYEYYRWNLSQPLLKDQSEELIDYLLSIKK